MKWNWGSKIALLYSGFVIFILFMVYLSFSQDFDLVTEDYYAEEIKYQKTIDKKSNSEKYNQTVVTTISNKLLHITFPESGNTIQGTLTFFRPSNSDLDFEQSFDTEEDLVKVPLSKFKSGKYLLKADWISGEQEFYKEITLIIP